MPRKEIILPVIALLVLASAGVGFYVLLKNGTTFSDQTPISNQTQSTSKYSGTVTPSAVLQTKSQSYALAKTYQKAGNSALALEYFKKALPDAEDKVQTAQIRYNIAVMTEQTGDYKSAIQQLKTIAADTLNYTLVRAYAAQELANMYYAFYDGRDVMVAETFKDPPYDAFKKDVDVATAYRNLFAYAASIYPLGEAESRIAYMDASTLLNQLHSATTTPQGKQTIASILENISKADADIERIKADSTGAIDIPSILTREGVALGFLAKAGAVAPKEAEQRFQTAMQYTATLTLTPGGYTAYNYAAFLVMQYGSQRAEDIKKLLSPFRVGNEENIVPRVAVFYKLARTDTLLKKEKKHLLALGNVDSDFKSYLISLGWKQSDFSQ